MSLLENVQHQRLAYVSIRKRTVPKTCPTYSYNVFCKLFSDLYDITCPEEEVEFKVKYLETN